MRPDYALLSALGALLPILSSCSTPSKDTLDMLRVGGVGGDSSYVLTETAYVVKNNSGDTLRCRHRVGEGSWSGYRTLRPAAEFRLAHAPGMGRVLFYCDPPVTRTSYALDAGRRYSLLRSADGLIELRDIFTDGGFGTLLED